jgi:membrane protein YdbS with pleckstrin-like domain
MDRAVTQHEVRLRKGSSLKDRLIRASLGVLVLLFAVPGLVSWAWERELPNLAAFLALPLGSFLLGVAALERNVAWIITPNGILIGEQRPLGHVRKTFIRSREVSHIDVRRGGIANPFSFTLACRLASGEVLVSPPLPDVTRVNQTSAAIARLLGLREIAAVDNPLEATSSEIRLGKPVDPDRGPRVLIVVAIVAGVCGLLFAAALSQADAFSAQAIVLWSLGLIVALGFYKYAYRLAGTCWIIRHGEIRIERIVLNGRYRADTIDIGDVDTIDIERGNSRGDRHVITMRLRSGGKFRSPDITGEDQAHAVRAEIIRRLEVDQREHSA